MLALGLGALADCPWLALRKTLRRPTAVAVLAAQLVLPGLLAAWVLSSAEGGGGLLLAGNALVVVFNLLISHLREHLPAD